MPTEDYHDQTTTALTNAYVLFKPINASKAFSIINDDAADNIEISWDGVNQAKSIAAGESYDRSPYSGFLPGIWIKSTPAGANYRLEFEPSA